MIRLVAIVGVFACLSQAPTRPGSALVPGLQLVYLSGADTQAAWTIDSVSLDQAYEGRTGCSRVVLRMGPSPAITRQLCRSGDTLLSWDPRPRRWEPQRPLAKGVTVTMPRVAAGRSIYEAGSPGCEQLGTTRIATIASTVLATDSTGRPVRRLREHYAPGLTTATSGVFEVPDGAGWKVEREFRLVELRYPVGTQGPVEC